MSAADPPPLSPRDAVLLLMHERATQSGAAGAPARAALLPVVALVQAHGRAAAAVATPAALPRHFAAGAGGPTAYKTLPTGTSALHWVARHGKAEYVGLLLARGADVAAVDVHGRSAVMAACAAGSVDVLRVLLAWGARVDGADVKGYTSLLLAALRGSVEVVEVLLAAAAAAAAAAGEGMRDAGGDRFVNARLPSGQTALAVAARNGDMRMVRALVAAGAHHSLTYDGESVVELAIKHGHREVADWLVAASLDDSALGRRHAQLMHREVRPGAVDEYGRPQPPVAL